MLLTTSSIANRISSGVQHDGLRQAGHQVAATHFRLALVFRLGRRTDRDLDFLGGAFADRDAVLATHVGLDRGVDVERADPHGLQGDDATEADDGRLGRTATDVDDHVADGLVDGQVGADRGGHRLLDQLGIGGTGTAGGVGDGATLDLGDGRRHTDDDLRAGEAADTDALQQQTDHPLGDLEVGDGTAAQRAHGDDVAGRAADHLPRLAAGGQHLTRLAVERDHRGLVEDDALALHVHQRVGGAEVDREVACHGSAPRPVLVVARAHTIHHFTASLWREGVDVLAEADHARLVPRATAGEHRDQSDDDDDSDADDDTDHADTLSEDEEDDRDEVDDGSTEGTSDGATSSWAPVPQSAPSAQTSCFQMGALALSASIA